MKSHLILSRQHPLKSTKLVAVLLVAFLALCAVGIVSSTAQSTQKGERELEDKIPKHLPIKVKVKNSEKVKDLNNDQWMRDVEIEVQNTGDKPIYYLRLSLYFVDVTLESGAQLGFPIDYGNPQFVDFEKRATSQDVPLRPGETYVYQFSKRWAGRWEKFKVNRQLPHPKKIGLQFEVLSYGDGTGFVSTGGTPVPNKQESNSECGTQNKAAANLKAIQATLPHRPPIARFQLASFLTGRVPAGNFFALHPTSPIPGMPSIQSGICCPSTSCFNLKLTLGGNCFCEDELGDPPLEAGSAACGTVGSICGTQGTNQFICDDNEHTCTSFFIIPCITPTPTPTTTPTPDPTPPPSCDPPEATQPNGTCIPFGPCPPVGTRGWLCDPRRMTPVRALA
ncbi:MAG TPA: hypothetical protein VEZ40_04980 [Pyrinomonadaceae bacterium]|nr:hypothetical protein [Pyrinomonadaceae bacterium]